jgi:hypothetical protein
VAQSPRLHGAAASRVARHARSRCSPLAHHRAHRSAARVVPMRAATWLLRLSASVGQSPLFSRRNKPHDRELHELCDGRRRVPQLGSTPALEQCVRGSTTSTFGSSVRAELGLGAVVRARGLSEGRCLAEQSRERGARVCQLAAHFCSVAAPRHGCNLAFARTVGSRTRTVA